MNPIEQLEKLVKKYYGYVADLEGASVEILDLLFVRDPIQSILDQSKPETVIPERLYNQVYRLDDLLWQERSHFLQVIGERELVHARVQQQSPRSHWWWYLDQLKAPAKPAEEPAGHLAWSLAPAG